MRHHGFIPWDDDVDIVMPRKDYDILLSLKNSGFAPGFFLRTPLNNYSCFYGGYSKLRRDGTAIINLHDEDTQVRDYHHGICIDIFPLDICPEKKKTRKKLQNRLTFLQRIVHYHSLFPKMSREAEQAFITCWQNVSAERICLNELIVFVEIRTHRYCIFSIY